MRYICTLTIVLFLFNVIPAQNSNVWINEFHYDNSSTDYNEGVELAGIAGTKLSGFHISFYNGNDSNVYKSYTIPINSNIVNDGSGLGAIWFDISGLQNGPDGIALSSPTGELIQFISYEGSFLAKDGPATGTISKDVLVAEGASTDSSLSLQLTGVGISNEDFTWQADLMRSPGFCNTNQQLGPIPDTLSPELEAGFPQLKSVSSTQASFEIKLNEPAVVYYKVQLALADAPTSDDLIQADSLIYSDTSKIDLIAFSELQGETSYTVYFYARDTLNTPNFPDALTAITFNTPIFQEIILNYPNSPDSCFLGDSLEILWESENIEQVRFLAQTYSGEYWSMFLDTLITGVQNSFQFHLKPEFEADSLQVIIMDDENIRIADTSDMIFLVDTLAPEIIRFEPASGIVNTRLIDSFRIEFNEPVQLNDSGSIRIFNWEDNSMVELITIEGIARIDDKSIAFYPDSLLKGGTTYFVQVSAGLVVDSDTNPNAGIFDNYAWFFSTQQPGIFYSEYLEGSGYNKAIELYNPTDTVIDLTEFVFKRSSNGEGWVDSLVVETVLGPGSTYVIAHSSADSVIKIRADLLSSFASHNGNDAFGIFKNDMILDVIGNPFENPGDGWNVGDVETATKDYTLLRKSGVFAGNSDWQQSFGTNGTNSEWEVYLKDYYSNLGKLSCKPDTNTVPIFVSIPGYSIDTALEIFSEQDSIVVTLIQSSELDSLIPLFVLPSGARIFPENGTLIDFSSGSAIFTVTAEDMLTQHIWKVFIKQLDHPVSGHDILEISFSGMQGEAMIDTSAHTIRSLIPYNASIDELEYSIKLSPGAKYIKLENQNDTVQIEVMAEDSSKVIWNLELHRQVPFDCSISEIQKKCDDNGNSLMVGQLVRINGIVTGVDENGFYLQDSDSLWSGIYNYTDNMVQIGDSVSVVGLVDEWIYITEISPVYDIELLAEKRILPGPIRGTVSEVKEESAENLLVRIEQVKCIKWNELAGIAEVTDELDTIRIIVDTLVGQLLPQNYYTITGIATLEFGNHLLLPQKAPDIVELGTLEPSSDATISSIKINGEELEGFNSAVLNYQYTVDAGMDLLPEVFCIPGDSNSSVEITGCAEPPAQGESCTITIRITAEDGITMLEYSIVIINVTSSVKEEMELMLFYPNPVGDNLYVAATNIQRLKIYDLEGRIKLSKDIKSALPVSIDVSGLTPGVYIIEIRIGNQQISYRIIKN